MNKAAALLVVNMLLWLPGITPALALESLNAAAVAVADQSAQARAVASREALAQVLVKVSGSTDVLDNPDIAAALDSARQHVQQYGYLPDGEGGLLVRFEFAPDWVTDLVVEAGEPLWTAKRPSVLIWLVVEQEGFRQFASSENLPGLVADLNREFERRGVPLKLPLYDLVDSAALDTSQAWNLEANALLQASARYGLNDILAGRVVMLSSGQWIGDWSYLYDRNRIDRTVTAIDSEFFFREGAAIAAESMAARYAVAPARSGHGDVVLYIDGVINYADYAGIVSSLERLELVEHANVERIQNQRITLRLYTRADASQLASQIELDRRFQPQVVANSHGELNYQWQR